MTRPARETGLRRRARAGPPVFSKSPASLNAVGRPVRMPSATR
ncbi:MAG: hypothetical protein PHN82_04740 [bacterium]|nr:hypothetical protein [bacterium]